MPNEVTIPTIFVNQKRAFLVLPGRRPPRNSRPVISYPDKNILAWVFAKSTFGHPNGARTPSNSPLITYDEYVKTVLERCLARTSSDATTQNGGTN